MEQIGFFVKLTEHPAYDSWWQSQAMDKLLAKEPLKVPVMLVHSLWDQEDIYGAVAVYKAGKQRTLSWGARRQERRKHGYGGQKFPELKRTAKTTKKALVKLKCRTCNYTIERLGIRLRKLEVGS